MKYFKLLLAHILILVAFDNGFAQHLDAAKNFELYLLMGQSNMAGRGPLTDSLKTSGHDSVFVFTKDREWIRAKHPLHFDKPKAVGVGPGLAFGVAMAARDPKAKIGLVPCAVGGTAIEAWVPGAFDPATKTHPFDDAVERIMEAKKYGTIKGVIWHQGEANDTPEKSFEYLKKLEELIKRIRAVTGNPGLPFIAGELAIT